MSSLVCHFIVVFVIFDLVMYALVFKLSLPFLLLYKKPSNILKIFNITNIKLLIQKIKNKKTLTLKDNEDFEVHKLVQ